MNSSQSNVPLVFLESSVTSLGLWAEATLEWWVQCERLEFQEVWGRATRSPNTGLLPPDSALTAGRVSSWLAIPRVFPISVQEQLWSS